MEKLKNDIYDLKGHEAIDLWLSGFELWNTWVVDHSIANVDFEDVDFEKFRMKHPLKEYSFENYKFPTGNVSFNGAQFGDGDVSFRYAEFGDGEVSFYGASFGDGVVTFLYAEFGDGDVSFFEANFGKGEVDFGNVKFGDGDIDFAKSEFGDGSVDFGNVKFGNGDISFVDTEFGDGDVDFRNAEFGDGDVIFFAAEFGIGDANFYDVKFGDGDVSFNSIRTTKGGFLFKPKSLSFCKKLDMSDATFGSTLNISGIDSPTALNLQHTKLSNPIDLDNANIRFRSAYHYLDFKKAIDPSDSTSFRRLKKLAKEAEDNERSLDFFAKEMRSAYWYSISGPRLALFYLYDWMSDYGRSIMRPLVGLLVTVALYAQLYLNHATAIDRKYEDALVFSVGHALPIYPGVREISKDMAILLFSEDYAQAPWWLSAIITSQYILSSILLFLLVLALRNRFRS